MKKSIIISCISLCFSTFMHATPPMGTTPKMESMTNQKLTPVSISIDISKLQSPQTLSALEDLYTQLIAQLSTDNEIGYQSVLFQTQVDAKNNKINVSTYRYYQENSFAASLQEIMKNSFQDNCIQVDGVTIKTGEHNKQQDLNKAKELAQNVFKIMSQSNYSTKDQITSSINIEYQTL